MYIISCNWTSLSNIVLLFTSIFCVPLASGSNFLKFTTRRC